MRGRAFLRLNPHSSTGKTASGFLWLTFPVPPGRRVGGSKAAMDQSGCGTSAPDRLYLMLEFCAAAEASHKRRGRKCWGGGVWFHLPWS